MARYDASKAECLVYTFKEGILSKIAHDLKIRVGRFEVDVADDAVSAVFHADSLEVVCVRKDGADASGTLNRIERGTIEGNIRKDVLRTKKHPEIRFQSTKVTKHDDHAEVEGELTLHGVTRKLATKVVREGDHWLARVRLHQPDYKIKPYSAMLGTLKIKPEIEVELRVPVA